MADIILNAEVRKLVGKRAKRLRKEGKVPGIFYIHGEDNVTIEVPEAALHPLIYTSEAHVINLKLNNGLERSCILRDIQFDPVTDRPIHFDLQGVKAEERLTLEIPVVLVGTPKGVKDGGTMQRVLHRLQVECLPRHIPEHIEVNVENLGINESIHVKDIKLENVTILENENSTIVAIVPPTVLKEEVPTAAPVEEITEPEVIGKGKKEEEEEAEEEAPKQAAPAAKKEEKKAEGGKPGDER
jgi:large subunit ribosomal protein L25